jgi:hypothetical protein
MVYFQNKNPNLGKFWKVLQSNMLVYFMAIRYITYRVLWYILRPSGIFLALWYIFGLLSIFLAVWYILWYLVCICIFPVLVCCSKNNLATLRWNLKCRFWLVGLWHFVTDASFSFEMSRRHYVEKKKLSRFWFWGSMLWSKFSPIFANFGEKIAFFSKTMLRSNLADISSSSTRKRQFFGRKYYNIGPRKY